MVECIKCVVCGSSDHMVLYESTLGEKEQDIDPKLFSVFADRRHHRIVACRSCGLVYVDPLKEDDTILEAYRNLPPDEYLRERVNRERIFGEKVALIGRFIEKAGRLLDIGCSAGLFMNVAKSRGWDVKGVEPSRHSAAFARREFGIDVFEGDVDDLFGETFDVVTMWDVLEHLVDPGRVMSKVHSLLDQDGICALSTPDVRSALARVMGEKWHNINRTHLYYFDGRTLAGFLRKHGFELVYQGRFPRIFTLGYLTEKAKGFLPMLGSWMEIVLCRTFRLEGVTIRVNLFDELTVIVRKL